MLLNPDATKQAQEVILSHKAMNIDQPTAYFNNAPAKYFLKASILECTMINI